MRPGQLGPITVTSLSLDVVDDADRVRDGYALGDADDDRDAGVDGLHYGVGCEGGRNEYEGHVRAGLVDRVRDRVVDGHRVLEQPAALSGRDAGDQVGAVLPAAAGMEAALPAGDPLHQESRVRVGENTQEALPFVGSYGLCKIRSA